MSTPNLVDRYIIAGRLKGYLGKPEEAIDLLTEGLQEYPDDVRLLRFRGHRRISVRDYEGAKDDLTQAGDAISTIPDGYELYQRELEQDIISLLLDRTDSVRIQHLPINKAADYPDRDLYRTTLYTSIWYYLGVANYLNGDIDGCLGPFEQAEATAVSPEGVVPALDWQFMALTRLGRNDDASVVLQRFAELPDDAGSSEPGYRNRMLLYTGQLAPRQLRDELFDDKVAMATQGYGLGNWYMANEQHEQAYEVFSHVLATGAQYAFGYLAAEAELRAAGRLGTG